MRVIALVLAISVVALARPQFRLSEKEYEALQIALDGRIPVAISSGRQLYNDVEDNANNFVVVDFGQPPVIDAALVRDAGGKPAKAPKAPKGPIDIGAGLNDFGQGVLLFGQGVLDALGDTAAGLGRAAEDTLQGLGSLVGIARTGDAAPVAGRTLTVAAEEAPAVIVVDEGAAVAPVASRTLTVAVEEAPAVIFVDEGAAVDVGAGAAVAEVRTGPVVAEDTAIAPAAPEEAIVAPALVETEVAVAPAIIRRKRQLLDDEEPLSNARQIGTGLGTLAGLFGSTVGRFMDSVSAAAVEMIDGLESLGHITLDQVENSFDDNPDNDFIRR